MAKLMPDRQSGKLTIVSWGKYVPGQSSVHSKNLHKVKRALLFKRLVEEAGEDWPPFHVLQEHGLEQYGYNINPTFVLGLRAAVLREGMSAEEKIKFLTQALKDF